MKSNISPDSISYILCAAGKGERFLNHGLSIPKPMLRLNGKSMLERSIDSLTLSADDQLIIISQSEHKLKESHRDLSFADWVEIKGHTRGQLDTFLLAKDLIKHNHIVIYNCDTYFESAALLQAIKSNLYDGIIPCSQEQGEVWSFCKVDDDFNVLKVTEKLRISDWASVGYYYFRGIQSLLDFSLMEVKSNLHKESYVAPLYERYIEKGLKIKMVPVEKFLPFGTLEQLKEYWGISVEELISQNK